MHSFRPLFVTPDRRQRSLALRSSGLRCSPETVMDACGAADA